jgi:hypothetical protein
METLSSILAVLFGVVLRLLVPIAVTALIVYELRKLDARWQEEAEKEHKTLVIDEMPCLKMQGISIEQMKLRASLSAQPCWQVKRSHSGHLSEACLSCEVFLDAPVPAPITHAHV